jgi:hypothetical protein
LFVGYRPASSPTKGVYNPKAVVLHAALLRQAFAHCAISLTAASRRSLGRLSVPVWGTTLSGPLPVVGWVSRYLTYDLMGRSPLPQPRGFPRLLLVQSSPCGISRPFERLSPAEGQVSYVLRTRSPLCTLLHTVRLACIRHAASVHPEPGSNSPSDDSLTRVSAHRRPQTPGGFVLGKLSQRDSRLLLLTCCAFPITIQLLRCPQPP